MHLFILISSDLISPYKRNIEIVSFNHCNKKFFSGRKGQSSLSYNKLRHKIALKAQKTRQLSTNSDNKNEKYCSSRKYRISSYKRLASNIYCLLLSTAPLTLRFATEINVEKNIFLKILVPLSEICHGS